jgi:cytochrome c oxidase assembly protein subunit 15
MTGRMGCPDWPKCFGLYSTHRYQGTHMDPNREFEEGQVIIKDDKLWVANGNFTTQNIFNKQQWRYIRNTIMRYSTPQKH